MCISNLDNIYVLNETFSTVLHYAETIFAFVLHDDLNFSHEFFPR